MEHETIRLYEKCIRFDEGRMCQNTHYKQVIAEEERLRRMIEDVYGAGIVPLLGEYTAAIYEEMELEARHYFEQGIKMRQNHT